MIFGQIRNLAHVNNALPYKNHFASISEVSSLNRVEIDSAGYFFTCVVSTIPIGGFIFGDIV
jgi:hypothetical protein